MVCGYCIQCPYVELCQYSQCKSREYDKSDMEEKQTRQECIPQNEVND